MKMIKLNAITVAALGALVAFAPISRAQTADTANQERPAAGQPQRRAAGPAGENAFNRMAEQLKLTDEQKAKLQPIFREEMTKLRELRQDTSLTREQRTEKTRTIREQYLAKMKPELKAEQFEQLKKMRETQATRGPQGERNRGGQGQGQGQGGGQPQR
ncbi:MAG: hypothetical protein AB9869_04225 [Verrucomicrobiia bacterium]